MTLEQLNGLASDDAIALLLACCGSREWATRMNELRPFGSMEIVLDAADREWLRLGEADWLEAFSAHPRIGERSDSPAPQREQAAVYSAGDNITRALAKANADYHRRFGFSFIVFATGKTPEQILDIMNQRLAHTRDVEIRNAVAEQMKITRLRLQRLVGD
ncbi:MAG: 2-oxo-4-hydroxy-4-carboxy-5-ureidoimidazoline decarboxylase [Gemmatimonadota bacterium]